MFDWRRIARAAGRRLQPRTRLQQTRQFLRIVGSRALPKGAIDVRELAPDMTPPEPLSADYGAVAVRFANAKVATHAARPTAGLKQKAKATVLRWRWRQAGMLAQAHAMSRSMILSPNTDGLQSDRPKEQSAP
jgi:hypothetical protein